MPLTSIRPALRAGTPRIELIPDGSPVIIDGDTGTVTIEKDDAAKEVEVVPA